MSVQSPQLRDPIGDVGSAASSVDPPAFLPPPEELMPRAVALSNGYRTAAPFPHAVIDGLVDLDGLRRVAAELPSVADRGWVTWDTATEWKQVYDRPERFGPAARRLSRELNSTEFVRFLERLTGISGLIPDPHLRAAGYFSVPVGGFLDPHIDFTTNDELGLVRRVNALVYLNEDWRPEWGGQLELWSSESGGAQVSIVPEMGRLAVFDTPGALHGHPAPVRTPDGRSRLCFSAYYYTSPTAPDQPIGRSGVLWTESSRKQRAQAALDQVLPPVLNRRLKQVRRHFRRRRALRS